MRLKTEHQVVGWGYEGKTPGDLVAFAQHWHAKTVVDIRLNPVSRKPGFSKRRLNEVLTEAGLVYAHMPELGNPRDNRAGFADTTGAVGRAARERFIDEVLDASAGQRALKALRELAASGSAVLLCYEHDEPCCHRALVLDALAEREPHLSSA